MLGRLAVYCYQHRRRVLLAWATVVITAIALGPTLAGRWTDTSRLPGTDSQAAYDVLKAQFPAQAGEADTAVFPHIAASQGAAQRFLAELARQPGVIGVGSLQLAPGGEVAIAPFRLDTGAGTHPAQVATAVQDQARQARLAVAFSGESFTTGSLPSSEIIGILAALVVLLVVLGSLFAAGLPVLIALAGIGVAIPLIGIAARAVPTPNFTDQVAAMIGIGVGIDYTLLVVTRYRAALARLVDPKIAVQEALSGAGQSVVLAGSTVVVSLMGLFVMDLATFDGLAVGTALAVLAVVAATLTLLPALLGFAGMRLFARSRARAARRRTRPRSAFGPRLADWILRRPASLASVGLLAVLLLAAPALHMHLGTADAGTDPPGSTTRTAYDLTVRGFGAGAVGPIQVVAQASHPGTEAVPALESALRATPGVVAVDPPVTSPAGAATVIQVTPAWGPADRHTANLIDRIRHLTLPAVEQQTGMTAHVGGETASDIDFATVTARHLPLLIVGVLAISFLLLLVGFRSVPVAVQAILLNLLSVGAAYGIVVAVFQWGWASNLLGASAAPVAPWIPPLLFAITFGLSMDYEVFIIGGIRDARAHHRDPRAAVAEGLSSTAGVVSAAALIMALVFASFVTSNALDLKVIGVGLAAAIIVDATLIRLLIVPASMTILGAAAWWHPRWLDRPPPTVTPSQTGQETEDAGRLSGSTGRPGHDAHITVAR